ncbi:hypothetical protein PRIPAC_77027 [Pristionchus pacificus]|uniref:Nuclear receptor n=1 Tax=Pristionchus pacificus TaxID=54126 RepID=A0A2A6CJ74_PRIPA|nr:hypothetical protein PRIPAC_77027 [Pristionchus pacificus]|eukprot:PDM78274.1 nuclear receptor [Pristionchus pacificus]
MASMSGARQQKERQSRPSVCVVCGDTAIGYNYGAASCAPCKAFFRRTIIGKYNSLTVCQRNGICAREPSLKPCRKCRYDRCIAGGMKPELVMFTDISELASTSNRTSSMDDASASASGGESNRTKVAHENVSFDHQTDEAEEAPCDPAPSSSEEEETRAVQIVANPFRIESKMEVLMQNLATLEAAHQRLRRSTYAPRLTTTLSIDDFVFAPSKLGEHFEVQMYSPAFNPFADMLFPPEMLVKMRVVLDLSDFDYTTRKLWAVQDMIYTIEYMKVLPIYQLLDDSSKRVLASSTLVCTNLMTAYYSYTHNSDRTLFPDGSVVTWTPDIQAQAPGATRMHTGIIAAFREVNIDEREYSLLKNIIICNPNLDGLQQYDATLLQHEQEREDVEIGPSRFVKIISIAEVANKLTSWQKAQYVTSIALDLLKPSCPFRDSVFHSP